MSGGVSLAVWMGGVAREINLLQQASRSLQRDPGPVPDQAVRPAPGGPDGSTAAVARAGDGDGTVVDPGHGPASPVDWDTQVRNLYRGLLDCLDITVTVDVLAGTSAGGVNAALLGLSSAAGADLAMLRDLWLKTGSMDLLLRDPAERNPPSLMQGDKVLFTQLAQGIEGFWERRPGPGTPFAPVSPPDTTVFITTTMMSGETSQFTDDYGTVVPDVDHHGLFTFHQKDLAPDPADRSSLDRTWWPGSSVPSRSAPEGPRAGSRTCPRMAEASTPEPISGRNGLNRIARVKPISDSDIRPSSRVPRKLRAVAHSTRPATSRRWRCHTSCATRPPIE